MCNCGGGAIRNIALRKEAARRTVEVASGGGNKKVRSTRVPVQTPTPTPAQKSIPTVRNQPLIISSSKLRNNALFIPKGLRKQRPTPSLTSASAPTSVSVSTSISDALEPLSSDVLANVNAVWGPPLWQALHSLAEITDDVVVWEGLLEKVHSTMPCPVCATHFGEWLQTHPLRLTGEAEGLTVSEPVSIWLLTLHNDVNRRTGKPEWTVEQLAASMGSVSAADNVSSVLGDIRTYISVELGDAIESCLVGRRP